MPTTCSSRSAQPLGVAAHRRLWRSIELTGLGQRIVESDGTTNTSLIYDERWRLISRSEAGKYTEETLYHHAGLDGMGGASDIDGVILRRTFLATGTPQTEEKRWYVLQNWRQDAAVIISDAGVQRERAFYSPYGRVFGMPAGDLNFDGEFTSAEATTISGWSAGYRAYADINLDGVIDGDDATANTPGALGWDALSRDGSTIGYAGYVQDSSIPTLSHVRHRVYKSDLGRWVQRDPAGYVDGANLYEYARSSPVVMRDWSGLATLGVYRNEGNCDIGVTCQSIVWPVQHCYTYIDCGEGNLRICSGGPEERIVSDAVVASSYGPGRGYGPLKAVCVDCDQPGLGPISKWDCEHYKQHRRGNKKDTHKYRTKTTGVDLHWECFQFVANRMSNCGFEYRLLGPNSNTVAKCISKICMGILYPPRQPAPGWGWGDDGNCLCLAYD